MALPSGSGFQRANSCLTLDVGNKKSRNNQEVAPTFFILWHLLDGNVRELLFAQGFVDGIAHKRQLVFETNVS